MPESRSPGVVRFYDTHPINEDEILAKLAATGVDLDALSENDLSRFDQDNYGGTAAVDTLAGKAGIERTHHVLDVCSGMGGPARWLAHTIGCRVTGIDLTASRVAAARRLTRRVGLDALVDFVHGDATAMPLADAAYDALISQEAWAHVPDKARLVAECARVLKPGGHLAFTNIVKREPLTREEDEQIANGMQQPDIPFADDYVNLLIANGCDIVSREDLSPVWREALVQRLAMYRSLRDTTVEKFGEAHFDAWDRVYTVFVGLYVAGKLGGTRIVARRAGA